MITVLSDLAKNIRKYREEKGLSLTTLADEAGISKGFLSSIETGKTPSPSIYTVAAIADALQVDLNKLVVRRGVTGYMRGHHCWYDYAEDVWRYLENDEIFDDTRKCPKCDKLPTAAGYDACIGKLDGATSVCCGHGVEDGYIVWGYSEPVEVVSE